MSANDIPDRVSADLRRYHAKNPGAFPPNEKRIQQAREEIIEEILEHHGWKGHTLGSVLVEHLNVAGVQFDQLCEVLAGHIQSLSAGYPAKDRDEARKFLRTLVESYIRDQWIEDRAAELAR
jgi:hypothetical protein